MKSISSDCHVSAAAVIRVLNAEPAELHDLIEQLRGSHIALKDLKQQFGLPMSCVPSLLQQQISPAFIQRYYR